jgi:hypothetical protein
MRSARLGEEDDLDSPLAQPTDDAQRQYFRITDRVPEQAWYWAALGSILVAAGLKLAGRDNWATFVGQWPPTFLLFGLYHKLLQPGH